MGVLGVLRGSVVTQESRKVFWAMSDSRTRLCHSVSLSESLRGICGLIAAWGPVQRRNSGFKKPPIDNRLLSFFHLSNYLSIDTISYERLHYS